jgi:TonB-dependent starch-binding outer membrane protein SusC
VLGGGDPIRSTSVASTPQTGSDVVDLIGSEGYEFVDLRFVDLPGLVQHFSVPVSSIEESVFTDGLFFDGSSVRGFQGIQESDMLLIPDVSTAQEDPFRDRRTLMLYCHVHDAITGESYSRDPRNVVRKAEAHLKATGIADTVFMGPEAEFFIFDSIRFQVAPHESFYSIDSVEGPWNTGREEEGGNLGYKPRTKQGYFPTPPMDHYQDLRSEMSAQLEETDTTDGKIKGPLIYRQSIWTRVTHWVWAICLFFLLFSGFAEAQGIKIVSVDHYSEALSESAELLHFAPAEVDDVNRDALNKIISIDLTDVPMEEALQHIADIGDLKIAYSKNAVDAPWQKPISIQYDRATILGALYAALGDTDLKLTLSSTSGSGQLVVVQGSVSEVDDLEQPLINEYQETVTGRVTDAAQGDPLPGVNVILEGTTTGTTTNIDGNFELPVPSLDETLVFSFIGYQSQTVEIDGRTEINIVLQQDVIAGEELVVVGYGVQRRSDITGSVGIASRDDLAQPTFNALQSLRGKISGVNIFTNSGSPTGSNRVIIRGTGSINASTDPLFVVDGVVMEDGLERMNPNDIESIEVLKDASATAIYGARGANGVVLITTERGGTDEAVIVGYNTDFSIGRMRGKMDVMNAEEFMEVQRIGLQNVPLFDPNVDVAPELDLSNDPDLFDAQGNPLYDTDWQDAATRTAFSHNHQLSLQGGGENSSVGAFLNFTDREGIFLNSFMNRASLKVVYDVNPRDWLSFGTNLTVSRTSENNVQESGGGHEVRRTIVEMAPIFPITWPEGTERAGMYSNSTHVNGLTLEGQPNPVHRLLEEDRLRDRTQLFGNTFAAVQINENLEFRTQFGIDNTQMEARNYGPRDLITAGAPEGSASIQNSETTFWQSENFLTYLQEIGPHRINSVLGASWQERSVRSNSLNARGFTDDNFLRFNNVGAATDSDPPSSNAYEWTLNSYFNRISYTYDDTYMFTFTGRVDGSSRFGADSKWGFFPSAGAAWLVTNEDFMSGFTFIDHLRMRTSYGITGNTEIGVFQSLATIGSGTTLIGGERQAQSFTTRLPNPDLEWEKTQQFNIGAELNLFNQAISLEADWYYKLTTDLLLERPVPGTTGFTTIQDNIGSLSNRGFDVMVTTRNVRTSDFFWSTTLNFNYNINRVESLGVEDEDILPGPNWVSGSQTILRVGEPIGNFLGFERDGTWNTDEVAEAAEAGRIPGEAKRSEDRTIIGNGLPDFTGSFINRFNFRNFDLLVDLQFVYGSEIMQQFLHTAEDRQALTNGLRTQLYNAWTEDNQDTPYQRIRHQPLSGQNTQADSHWIVDGSYIRANLISLGYNFDPSVLNRLGIRQLRLTANLENAFVIHSSDFKGHDPEATSWPGNIHAQNIFFYQYPRPRTATVGVNLRF